MYKHEDQRFLDYEKDVIARAKTTKIPGFEWQDIAQECMIALWKKFKKFNPSHGVKKRAFANMIITSTLKDLYRFVTRDKRLIEFSKRSLEDLTDEELDKAQSLNEGFYLFDNLAFYGQ